MSDLAGKYEALHQQHMNLLVEGDPRALDSTWIDQAGREFRLVKPINDLEAIVVYANGVEGRMSLRGCVQQSAPTGWGLG